MSRGRRVKGRKLHPELLRDARAERYSDGVRRRLVPGSGPAATPHPLFHFDYPTMVGTLATPGRAQLQVSSDCAAAGHASLVAPFIRTATFPFEQL
jgi:hypothetical protein